MKVALYIRVSTAVQFEKGNSVPEQKRRLQAYCESRDWNDYDFFIDPGHSGSNMDRPALQKLLRNITRYDLVLVYKLDRLSRNQRDILYLIEDVFLKNNVDFNSITENFDTTTPVGKLMLSIMGAFAELERQQINERMTMGRLAAAEKGKWRGGSGVPTGYRYSPKSKGGSGRLEIDEASAPFVKIMFSLADKGHTMNHICEEIGRMGFSLSGAYVVKTILQNPIYIGMQRYGGKIYPSDNDPLIDKDQFERVQEFVRTREKPSMKSRHLLTGFLYCSCGSRACYHGFKKSGRRYEYYECYTRMAHGKMRKAEKCPNKIWRKNDLEETVWNVLEELEYEDVQSNEPDRLAPAQNELKKTERQIEKLMDLFLLEDMPQDVLAQRMASLNRKKNDLLEEIDVLSVAQKKTTSSDFKKMKSKLSKIRQADLMTQREFLSSMIERITLLPDHDLEFQWKF